MKSRRKPRRVPRPPEALRELLRQYESSGLTRAEFAKEHGYSRSWIDRLLGKAKKISRGKKALIPVQVRSLPSQRAYTADSVFLEVVLRNDRLVRIPATFAPEVLPRLLEILEA